MLERECWWSLWILFVLFEFGWKREVCAIINPAKIGMILKLPMLSALNQMVREQSRIVPYPFWMSQHWFLLVTYQVLCWNWRSEDPKDMIEDPEYILHVPWSNFDSLSPLSPGKTLFISQVVKKAHKIQNCLCITSILSFHYFISFLAIWLYHIQSSIRGLLELYKNVYHPFCCVVFGILPTNMIEFNSVFSEIIKIITLLLLSNRVCISCHITHSNIQCHQMFLCQIAIVPRTLYTFFFMKYV